MKRVLVFLLAVIMLAATCACATTNTGASGGNVTAVLAAKGIELAKNMQELAKCDGYVDAISASAELKDVIHGISLADAPDAIYSISLDEKNAMAAILGGNTVEVSGELTTWLTNRAYASIPSYMASQSGVATLAATSSLAYGVCFVCEELKSPVLYLYKYNGDFGVMVSFLPGQGGAVNASAMFVPCDDTLKAANDSEAVSAWLSERFDNIKSSVTQIEIP